MGTYAIALDGDKRPCRVRSSNAGHVLWSGIAQPNRARLVGETLLAAPSFSGWGVRTIAEGEPRYNPMSYHNGSIWPHDNAIAAMGLARYGMKDKTAVLAAAMYDASLFVDLHRLPELFCGFSRDRKFQSAPGEYLVSCSPQAWGAGALFHLIQLLAGIHVDVLEKRIRVDPLETPLFERLRLEGMRAGDGTVDLTISRRRAGMKVRVDKAPSGMRLELPA